MCNQQLPEGGHLGTEVMVFQLVAITVITYNGKLF